MRLTNNKLSARRIKAGYDTALKAAQKVKCSRIYLLEIEEGLARPSDALAERIAKLLGVTPATVRKDNEAARRDLLERQLQQLRS